jgi:hypothetical protein
VVSGHSADGRPSSEPHLAIAPLAFGGARYASGAVFGFALIPPSGGGLLTTNDFRRAMRAISLLDEGTRRRVVKVYSAALDLTFAFGDGQLLREARRWRERDSKKSVPREVGYGAPARLCVLYGSGKGSSCC